VADLLTVNSCGPTSAVYHYACHANRVSPGSTLINLNLSGNLSTWPEGLEVRGFRTGLYSIDVGINSLIPRITFNKAMKLVRQAQFDHEPIHYSSLDVPPMSSYARGVVSIHDNPARLEAPGLYAASPGYQILQRLRWRTYREFPQILTGTDYVRKALLRSGVAGTVTTIRHPVSPKLMPLPEGKETLRDELRLPKDRKLVLSVSSDEPRKNLDILPKVMGVLGREFTLIRVGPSVPNSYTYSSVPIELLNKLYNASDVFIFPTLEEGLGLPVAEAMTCGIPVVASNIEVMHEVTGDAAILVDPLSPTKLASGVVEAISNPVERIRKGYVQARSFEFSRFETALGRYIMDIRNGKCGRENLVHG
jgi:glycosyltransferase involved in cell wall biosynthesis